MTWAGDETSDDAPPRPDRTEEVLAALGEAVLAAQELVGSPAVARSWTMPSALEGMTVGAVAAHIEVAVRMTLVLLAEERPESPRIALPLEFFGDNRRTGPEMDVAWAGGIVDAAEELAAAGPDAVADRLAATFAEVERTVVDPATPRTVATPRLDDAVARLDDYLATRVVEVVVHGDDLAVSAGLVWRPPGAAVDVAVGCLVAMARGRVGDLEVLRTLAREERATPGSLRTL
jgi:hypothetical protein